MGGKNQWNIRKKNHTRCEGKSDVFIRKWHRSVIFSTTPSATFFTFFHHLFLHFWLGLLRSFSYCKKAPLPRNKDELRSFSHRVWTDFCCVEAVSSRTCPGFPLASGRIFVTGGRGCDFSSESLRYVGSCARQFCKLCPISFDIIAKFFLTCCNAHLKEAPIVDF